MDELKEKTGEKAEESWIISKNLEEKMKEFGDKLIRVAKTVH